jgi:probable DNA metabolism protein
MMELFDSLELNAADDTTDYNDNKVMHEFDRLRGLLRFAPEKSWYIARCAPDHYVLPLLAEHFFQRFGKTSWAIIDEKRNIAFYSKNGEKPVMRRVNSSGAEKRNNLSTEGQHNGSTEPEQNDTADDWKELWKNYHRSINNEARANPKLQKQFIPSRYWKYLPEME